MAMINSGVRWLATALSVLALTACGKKEEKVVGPPPPKAEPVMTVEVVKESERSRNFVAVQQHLELGGTLYGYMDIEGDILKLAASLQEAAKEIAVVQPEVAPWAKQDFAELARILGLTDLKAIGASSVPDGTGFFRNRAFFYTGADRHGLMAGVGGKPGPFRYVNLAPADTAYYSESEMDLAAVYRTVREIIAKVGGETADKSVETALKRASESAAFSLVDLFNGLKGRTVVVLRVDETKTWRLPSAERLTIPVVSFLIRVDSIAPFVEQSLAKAGNFSRNDDGNLHIYGIPQALPMEGLAPVIVADGQALYIASNIDFFDECRAEKSGLGQTAAFKQALARVGQEGNGLSYISPRLFAQLRRTQTLNPNLPPQVSRVLDFVASRLPQRDRPSVSVRTNLADGILIKSDANHSLKQDAMMLTAYNPVTVGLLAAMAIPAFQKVRQSSQEKAVLNNLRQFMAAGDQYCLENGVAAAAYADLVGPGKYIRTLNPVAGEDYRTLRYEVGKPLVVKLRDGRVIRYDP